MLNDLLITFKNFQKNINLTITLEIDSSNKILTSIFQNAFNEESCIIQVYIRVNNFENMQTSLLREIIRSSDSVKDLVVRKKTIKHGCMSGPD